MSAMAAVAPTEKNMPERRSPRGRRRPPSASSSGPRKTPKMIGMLWLARSCSLRREPHAEPRQGRVEHEAAVGGVVVGDEHDRAARVRGRPVSATTFQVGRCGSSARRNQSRPPLTSSQTAAAATPPTSSGEQPAEQRRERRGGVQQAERPPVAAVGPLLLDADLAAGGAELACEPLRRPPLALGRRRALDRRRARGPPALSGPAHHGAGQTSARGTPGLADPDPLERRGMRAEQHVEQSGGSGSEMFSMAIARSKLDEVRPGRA